MKKTLLILITLFITITTFAQAPDLVNYQAIIRNATGNIIQDGNIGMRVSILQTNATGTSVYTETHTTSTNTNGLVTIMIGGGTTTDDFAAIDWSVGPYFIKTETDVAGGTNYTIVGTSQLLSVPYALYAKTAGSVEASGGGGTTNTPNPLNNNINTSFAFDSRDDNTINAWSNGNSWSSVSYIDTSYGPGDITASNGNFAFDSRDDNKIFAWSFVTYQWTSADYADTSYGASAVISSEGNFAFDARDDNKIFAWNATDGTWSSVTYVDTSYGPGALISSEGNFAFNSRDENKVYAWNATDGWSSVSYTDTSYGASDITTSNGNFIFDARDDNMFYVWNAQNGTWISTPYSDTSYGPGSIISSPHNNGN
jgi:hypothetical protein